MVNSCKILLADDDTITRRAIETVLSDMGYRVCCVQNGDEGCTALDEMAEDAPQLLITDFDMPGISGQELAEYARQRFDHIKLLYTSGISRPEVTHCVEVDSESRFLKKPFRSADLRAVLTDLGLR